MDREQQMHYIIKYANCQEKFSTKNQYCGPDKGRLDLIFRCIDITNDDDDKKTTLLGFLFGFLGKEHSLNVGQYTTLGDGNTGEKLVQLFVIPDRQLQMTGNDTGLFVIPCGVTSQLENFGGEVFHNGGQVNGSTGTDAFRVVALPEQPVNTADGEL